MSGFQSANAEKPINPAKVYHKWSSGVKTEVKTEAGVFSKIEGKLNHWDPEIHERTFTDTTPEKPFRFVVLEQTRRISGFNGNKRYYSNEAVKYNDVLRVSEKVQNQPAKIVATGTYRQLKEAKEIPEGASLAVQLYGYNPDTKQIEVLTLQKSSLKPFIKFSQENNIYKHEIWITGQGDKETFGSVEFYPPKFELGPAHTQEQIAEYLKYNAQVAEYLTKAVQGDNHQDQSEEVINELLGNDAPKPVPAEDDDIQFDDGFGQDIPF